MSKTDLSDFEKAIIVLIRLAAVAGVLLSLLQTVSAVIVASVGLEAGGFGRTAVVALGLQTVVCIVAYATAPSLVRLLSSDL